jgi:hypothetical protein
MLETALASTDLGAIIWVVIVVVAFVFSRIGRRARGGLRNSVEAKDGHVVLKESARQRLARNPRRLQEIEAELDKRFTVNERGQVVPRSTPAKASPRPAEPGADRPQPASSQPASPLPVSPRSAAPQPSGTRPATSPTRSFYRKPTKEDLLRGSETLRD